ncbi:DEAD-box ATP-dependent RNA helicase 38-like [Bidens hawaiensis]|uniref:DEAD-box ATP-dependent RNA helicase 38-like n=1 Tax=Bidens hawaiensis TaxID=980011 RepID=UPI004049E667
MEPCNNNMELCIDNMVATVYKVNVPDELSKIRVVTDNILKFAREGSVGQTIIYVSRKKIASALMLRDALVKDGHAVALTRDKLTKEFNDGSIRVLVSTDTLLVGFDQSQVNLVINMDLPADFFIRTRTARRFTPGYKLRIIEPGWVGCKGAVFNLLSGDAENRLMAEIQSDFNHDVTEVPSSNSDDDYKDALEKAGLM